MDLVTLEWMQYSVTSGRRVFLACTEQRIHDGTVATTHDTLLPPQNQQVMGNRYLSI